MSLSEVKKSAESRMGKSIETLKTGLSKIRTGRAHAGILDHVMVEYYGSPVPVSQVANVNLVDARTISVQVWEKNKIGRAHVRTPVTNANLVCRLLLEKKQKNIIH